jgi:predicted ATPase
LTHPTSRERGPALRLIATSREPLRVDGEWVYRVPPLDAPPEGSRDLEQVLRHGAAELFLARTRAANPATSLDGHCGSAVTKICRRLDGIPLATELAAESAAAIGVEGLARRLDDPSGLLRDGGRTAPARHQTPRATIDRSHGLLSEPERVAMRRLAVFEDDFTVDAAGAVAAIGEVTAADCVRRMASLVRKSLVVADFGGSVPRYRLFETTRAHAMAGLAGSGECETMTARHAGWHSPGIRCVELPGRFSREQMRLTPV